MNDKIIKSYIVQCEASLECARLNKSKLEHKILSATNSLSSISIRHFLNNLCSMTDVNYLEVGVARGITIAAAGYENLCNLYAIDNFKHREGNYPVYNEKGFLDVENNFNDTIRSFGIADRVILLKTDVNKVDVSKIKDINILFYDCVPVVSTEIPGALKRILKATNNIFILIVGNYNDKKVQEQTKLFITSNKLNTHYEKYMMSRGSRDSDGWWAGLGIFILEKNVV